MIVAYAYTLTTAPRIEHDCVSYSRSFAGWDDKRRPRVVITLDTSLRKEPAILDGQLQSRERKYRREIVSFRRMLHQRGYVAATDGNLSVRLDEQHILATPTAMSKGALRPADIVIVDPAGRQVAGCRHVTSEISTIFL